METTIIKEAMLVTTVRKMARFAGQLLTACTMTLMAVLVFFLLQSRLAGGTPAVAGYQIYTVLSGSMSPAFEAGSIILVSPLEAAAVRQGYIITYRDPDPAKAETIVTHRVVAVKPTEPVSFTTRGDANDANDPLPVPSGNLIGRVDYSIPYLGYVFSFVKTKTGLLLLVIVPAVLIIVSELRKLFGYAQALEKEKLTGGGSSG